MNNNRQINIYNVSPETHRVYICINVILFTGELICIWYMCIIYICKKNVSTHAVHEYVDA